MMVLWLMSLAWASQATSPPPPPKTCPERPVIVRIAADHADQVRQKFLMMSSLPYAIEMGNSAKEKEKELRIGYVCPRPQDNFKAPNSVELLQRVSQVLLPDGKKLGVKSIRLEATPAP